jgi:hypothetical protein
LEQHKDWPSLFRTAILKAIGEAFGKEWGYNVSDNLGLLAELTYEFDDLPEKSIQLLHRSVDSSGIKISAAVGEAITSVGEITQVVKRLLEAVSETLFTFLPKYDGETLSYWFLTGESLHGHIGEISFKRENMPHIDLSVVEYLMDDLEAARQRYPISARRAAETEKESG